MSLEENKITLKRRRATIQASCMRIKTFVESVASASIAPSIAAQLEERRAKLEHYWSEYESVQTKIECLDENESSHRAGFEEAFYTLTAQIRGLLSPVNLPRHVLTSTPTTSRASNVVESLSQLRLPKLNLPTFSGQYDEWFPFFDTFHFIIHVNESLDDIQKFQYLRASLAGDAKDIVNSLEISAVNYEVAWNLLKNRYDNKRVIAQNHIRAIMELPSMTRENACELRQIADGALKHIHALQALKRPTSYWDNLLIYVLSKKLDAISMREWQNSLTSTELPTFKQFLDFVTHRSQMLESTGKSSPSTTRTDLRSSSNLKRKSACVASVKLKCIHCSEEHSIYYCPKFLALAIPQRIAEIRKAKICLNCLRSSTHAANKCTAGNCKTCKMKHNTLLHLNASDIQSQGDDGRANKTAISNSASTTVVTHSSDSRDREYVLLATALVQAYDAEGTCKPCRILLDCGSQANFVSRAFLESLKIKTQFSNITISGVNNTVTRSSEIARIRVQSRICALNTTVDCIVTDKVTDKLPAFTLKRKAFEIPRNIKLADPQFHVSSDIDILVGAELFWQVLCIGQIKASLEHPTIQKTLFGWILAGRLQASTPARRIHSLHASVTNNQLSDQLTRFWQLETIENANNFTANEASCEEHFLNSITRNPQGRFIAKLPLNEQVVHKIGDTKATAMKRLLGLEKRFARDPNLRIQYARFLDEYQALGHMKQIPDATHHEQGVFYLPHHCVFKNTADSSKIRVVFDASCKSSTGLSLNDALLTGPVIQQDLTSILTRFRMFRYVLAADIIKMYRQILVHPSQTRYQRILWRDTPISDVKTYELTTVTYGTSSASFIATRCLKHLAEIYQDEYPVGSVCVQRDFYVDDLLTGADSLQDARVARSEVVNLLQEGGFELSKWSSNSPELLDHLGGQDGNVITINNDKDASILGIQWNQSLDTFYFTYKITKAQAIVSKRDILSEVSRLFDPLGLLGPIIVLAKLIMQELWQLDVHWDESILSDIDFKWRRLKTQLPAINQYNIPRCVKHSTDPQRIQLHGFCDASQRAYGACVYIRTQIGRDEFRSELLCSKSRVAPMKSVSLPRLELSVALLLSQLIRKIEAAIDLNNTRIFLWSDSTITLNWISSPSRKWTVFVANRVGEIQRITDINSWRHITSTDNPADILSRGLEPHDLLSASIWWHGPKFLMTSEDEWPDSHFKRLENIPEQTGSVVVLTAIESNCIEKLIGKFSNLNKIYRIIAYCLRFRKTYRPESPTRTISHFEIIAATNIMCKVVQKQSFPNEYKALAKGDVISTSSSLLSLSPFMQADGIMRVGGRLQNSKLDFNACHPILLPRGHKLTKR